MSELHCQHIPAIVHRSGGKPASLSNWCSICGSQIGRDSISDPWVAVFECAMCHKTFGLSRSGSDARAESAETWGTHPDKWQGGTEIVCGPCYQKIDPATHPEEAAIAKKEGL